MRVRSTKARLSEPGWKGCRRKRRSNTSATDWGKLREALTQGGGLRWSTLPNDHYALRGPNITKDNAAKTNHYGVATTEDDDGSFIAQPVSLKAHSQDVENWARRFVTNLTLEPALANDIVLAAWLHDIGKADPRFQRWLNGGAEVRKRAWKRRLRNPPRARATVASATWPVPAPTIRGAIVTNYFH